MKDDISIFTKSFICKNSNQAFFLNFFNHLRFVVIWIFDPHVLCKLSIKCNPLLGSCHLFWSKSQITVQTEFIDTPPSIPYPTIEMKRENNKALSFTQALITNRWKIWEKNTLEILAKQMIHLSSRMSRSKNPVASLEGMYVYDIYADVYLMCLVDPDTT